MLAAYDDGGATAVCRAFAAGGQQIAATVVRGPDLQSDQRGASRRARTREPDASAEPGYGPHKLANCLSELGRRVGALATAEKTVRLWRTSARPRPREPLKYIGYFRSSDLC